MLVAAQAVDLFTGLLPRLPIVTCRISLGYHRGHPTELACPLGPVSNGRRF